MKKHQSPPKPQAQTKLWPKSSLAWIRTAVGKVNWSLAWSSSPGHEYLRIHLKVVQGNAPEMRMTTRVIIMGWLFTAWTAFNVRLCW